MMSKSSATRGSVTQWVSTAVDKNIGSSSDPDVEDSEWQSCLDVLAETRNSECS
jgi:hypothetical protein